MSNYQEPLLVDLEDQVGCGFLCITGGDSSGGPTIDPTISTGGGGGGGGGSDPTVMNSV